MTTRRNFIKQVIVAGVVCNIRQMSRAIKKHNQNAV